MKALKFGGTSVGTPDSIKQVIQIILESHKNFGSKVFVVSAFSGVTNSLLELAELASEGKEWRTSFENLKQKHYEYAEALIKTNLIEETKKSVDERFEDLGSVLGSVEKKGIALGKDLDIVAGTGELLSAFIISQTINSLGQNSTFLDTRKLIRTDSHFQSAKVDFEVTNEQIQDYFEDKDGIHLTTGFIASNKLGETTTLGRGGSDYTVAIFGAALGASEIEIWTDVDGVLTADPRKVKTAFSLEGVSYQEALELSHFGAKVIYPPTVLPALRENIPIRIKNTFRPEARGTIVADKSFDNGYDAKCVTSLSNISILQIQGTAIMGVAGSAARIFDVLAERKIEVILISQASSEHSVSVVVPTKNVEEAVEFLHKEFAKEIEEGEMDEIIEEEDMSIISVIGENMRHRTGVSAKLFTALAKEKVNVKAIAQGSSELNISVVVNAENSQKALEAIHFEFFGC
jgi:aspartokinase/homoserine dehydrogenase 1